MDAPNAFNSLPKEIFANIIENSDIYAIENICSVSQNMCGTINIRNILLNRLKETNDNLDVQNYSTKELIRYSKIQPLKDYIGAGFGERAIYVYPDNKTIKFYDQTVEMGIEINQIMEFYNKPVLLTAEGKLYILNGNWKIINIENVCSISNSLVPPNNGLVILTKTGLSYIMQEKEIKKIEEPKDIIQIRSQFRLTDKGEVYSNLTKIEQLPRIVQITDPGIVLSADGKVFMINRETLTVKKLNDVENIVQIASTITHYRSVIGYGLNLNGDIINLFDVKYRTEGDYKRVVNYSDSFYGVTFDDKLIRVKNIIAYSYSDLQRNT